MLLRWATSIGTPGRVSVVIIGGVGSGSEAFCSSGSWFQVDQYGFGWNERPGVVLEERLAI